MAEWSTAVVDVLPDSAFLYVEGGGSKDADGKTTPRSLRHFPYRNASGSIDLPHLRNAIARIPQSSLPADKKKELQAHAQRLLEQQRGAAGKAALEVRFAKLDAEEHVVTSVVLSSYEDKPDGSVGPLLMSDALDADAQDWCSPQDVEAACEGYMANARALDVQHDGQAVSGAFPVQCYVFPYPTPDDRKSAFAGMPHTIWRAKLGDDVVHSGDWVMSAKLPDELWPDVESGELNAYSIGGQGFREPIDVATFPAVKVLDLPTTGA